MPNKKNKEKVKNLKEKLSKATSIVLADHTGLSANDINILRSKIKTAEGETTIAKNTLTKIALKDAKINKELTKHLEGQTTMIFGYGDSIAPIKAVFEFIKEFKLPKIKAGTVDGTYTTAETIKKLSELPSKEQLLTQVVRGLKSPINGVVNVLKGSQRKLIYTLSAIAKDSSFSGE